jgi:hypothetical protein
MSKLITHHVQHVTTNYNMIKKVTCDLPLTSNVLYEAVYMVNLDICLPTFEFNDDVIYTL